MFLCSSNKLAPSAGSPVTPVTCQSSVPVPTLTARPTFICMMVTPATTWRATATTASVRHTSSSASPCGGQVTSVAASRPDNHPLFQYCLNFCICLILSLCAGAKPAPGICFERVNSAGDPYGNCGKDSKGSFAKCNAW